MIETISRTLPIPEYFYGDGKPHWREGKQQRPAMSSQDAASKLRNRVEYLKSYCIGSTRASRIIIKLEGCKPDDRCDSGACPLCARAFQRRFVDESERALLVARADDPTLCLSVLSIIPTHEVNGTTGRPMLALGRLKKWLKSSGLTFAIGGLDLSWNEGDGRLQAEAVADAWVAHFWLITSTAEAQRNRKALALAFPSIKGVSRPVRRDDYDGGSAGLAYALKVDLVRRQSVGVITDPDPWGQTVTYLNTRSRELRVRELVRSLLLLDHLGLPNRLVLFEANRHGI